MLEVAAIFRAFGPAWRLANAGGLSEILCVRRFAH